MPLILASGSPIRQQLLQSTGLAFDIVKPDIDEKPIQQIFQDQPALAALKLACVKALAVSEQFKPAMVIGADQTLSFQGKLWEKPKSFEDLRQRLLLMNGHSHQLCGGYAIACNQKIVWAHSHKTHLQMRALSILQIDQYLELAEKNVLNSVGGYHLEGIGIQLFESLKGSYLSMLGFDIVPVLNFLSKHNPTDIKGII